MKKTIKVEQDTHKRLDMYRARNSLKTMDKALKNLLDLAEKKEKVK